MTGYKSTILSIDTATGPCSVAVLKDGKIAACLENSDSTRQSALLVPMIEQALREANIGYAELERIACTVGPGSFTGIRVGLAAANAIAFAAGIPAQGFTTLETVAFAARKEAAGRPILAVLGAGKGEWYYQAFSAHPAWHALGEAEVGPPEKALEQAPAGAVVAGNCTGLPEGFAVAALRFPRADALAMLAAAHDALPRTLAPYYIRKPDAKPMAVDSATK